MLRHHDITIKAYKPRYVEPMPTVYNAGDLGRLSCWSDPQLPTIDRLPPFRVQTIPTALADELSLSVRIPGPRPGVGYEVHLV